MKDFELLLVLFLICSSIINFLALYNICKQSKLSIYDYGYALITVIVVNVVQIIFGITLVLALYGYVDLNTVV